MRNAWKIGLYLCWLAIGCGSPEDGLVAEVGSHQITVRSLRTYVEELPDGLRPGTTGDEARRHYLQSLIDGRLLLMEARDLDLDTIQTVRTGVEDAVSARVRLLYRTRMITSKVDIPEEDVKEYFTSEGFDRERKFSGILVASRAAVDTVLTELQNGRPFEEIAMERSLDRRSARQGGELGFIGLDMAPRLHIPPDVFRSLPLGEISEPLRSGQKWHVVRFTEERAVPYEKYRSSITSILFKERTAEREQEHLEQLGESFKVRIDPAGIQELVAAYGNQELSSLATSQTPVYLHQEGTISVAEVQEMLMQLRVRSGFADSDQAAFTLKRLILNPLLFEMAARREGLYGKDEVEQFAAKKEEEFLLETLRKEIINRDLDIPEEKVREYYDANPTIFTHEPATWIEELLLATEAEAEEMRRQVESGVPFADLVHLSLRENVPENGHRLHIHPREKVIYPKLLPVIIKTPPGQLVGPLEVKGGFSVFRMLGFEEAQVEPYETARPRALALMRRQRENQELQAFIERLREKYASRIEIDESRLAEALPNNLVQN
jgi:peptidyl-prolyl cis-trans isomerase C